MTKKKKSKFIKITAVFVSAVFLWNQIVRAESGPVSAAFLVRADQSETFDRTKLGADDITLPYNLAHKNETYAGASGETIIHLQDAHASLSAQYSLVNLLDMLTKDYELEFIALEGTEGVIDTSLLKNFPDKKIREKTADFLMREGRMSAGEFFEITRDKDNIMLCGVEDNVLYKENLKEFRSVIEQRESLIKMVDSFRKQISALEEKVYSAELRELMYKGRDHKKGEISFLEYWRQLKPFLDKFTIETRHFKDIPLLVRSIELEAKIDFEKANAERANLVTVLTERLEKNSLETLVLESVNFKEQKISPANFHKYLKKLAEKNNITAMDYKNFYMFTEYMTLYESVDIFNLYDELELVEKNMRDKFYRNNDERRLFEISFMTELLRGLYSAELSSRDFIFFKERRADYNAAKFASFLRELCGKYDATIRDGYDLSEMLGGINKAVSFYETAARRDRRMIENTIKRMKEEKKKVAALITGGYHTKGLTEIMKENKLSYLIVSPKFEKDEERPYVAILTGKKKPYQALLDSGKYQIAGQAWYDPNDSLDEQALKEQEIALLAGGIAGLYDSGKWKKLIEEWRIEIDPDSDMQDVLNKLVVRRIGSTVLAGINNRPLVALEKDREGNPVRTKITKKHRKIWERRTGIALSNLKKEKILPEAVLDNPFVLSNENINRIYKRISEMTNGQREYDKEVLLNIMTRIFRAMGVSKKAVKSEEADKFMQTVIKKFEESDGREDQKTINVKTVEIVKDIEPETNVYLPMPGLSKPQEKDAREKTPKTSTKKEFTTITASFTFVLFLCYMVLCHAPLPRGFCAQPSEADWMSNAGIGMLLAKEAGIELMPVEEFVDNTGVVISLPYGARAIGTEDGVSSHPEETAALFEKLKVPSVIVNLKIGSGDASGIEYSDDGMPLGFKDLDLAVRDMVSLINIAADKNLTIMLHDDDIKETHQDVLEDMMKSMVMAKIDRELLNKVKGDEDIGANWDYVEYIGFFNKPDSTGVDSANVINAVKIGHLYIRTCGKPVCVGPIDIENIEDYLPASLLLMEGDNYLIRVSKNNTEELLEGLENTIGGIELPEGVNIGYGELPENIAGESVVLSALRAAYTGGAQSAHFCYEEPEDIFVSETYEKDATDAIESADDDGMILTNYLDDDAFLQSKTLKEPDADGNIYYHYINEAYYTGENPEDNHGRIDAIVKADPTSDNELAFEFEYVDDSSSDKNEDYRYKYGYSDAERTILVMQYEYDESGRLKNKEDYVRGVTYVYYAGGDFIESMTLSVPDATGNIYYHYMNEKQSRIDRVKRKAPNDKNEIAFEYTYHPAPYDDMHKTVTSFSGWDAENKVGVNKVAVYEYDINGNPVVEPEPKPTPKPEPKQEPEPKPESKPEPKQEPETKPTPKPEPKQEPETKPTPKPEPKQEPETKPESKPEPKQEPETKPEPEEPVQEDNTDINIDTDVSQDSSETTLIINDAEDAADDTEDVNTIVTDEVSVDKSDGASDTSGSGCFISLAASDNKPVQVNNKQKNTPIKKDFERENVKDRILTKPVDELNETEFKIMLGLPEEIYSAILKSSSKDLFLEITEKVELIIFKRSFDRKIMQEEFNKETNGKRIIGAIIDPTAFENINNFNEFIMVIEDFVKTAKEKITPLMAPLAGPFKIKRLTSKEIKEDFSKLEKLTEEKKTEWDNKIQVLMRTLPAESLQLMKYGAYHIPINNWHRKVIGENEISSTVKNFIQTGYGSATNYKYISVSAYDLADMRFIANTIEDLGINQHKASEFIHVRLCSENVKTREDLKKYMKKTGLDGYLNIDNVDIISEQEEKDMTLEKILENVKNRFSKHALSGGDITNGQIFIGSTKDLIFSESDKEILSMNEKAPKFIQMKGDGIISQLLLALVEFSASGEIPVSLGKITLDPRLNIYIYIPKIKKADYEAIREVRKNYEIMHTSA